MTTLGIETATVQLEQALWNLLRRKLQVAVATVADATAVRAYPTQSNGANATTAGVLLNVTSIGVRVEWSKASTATDNGTSVWRPNDVAASSAGRWLVTTAPIAAGVAKRVSYWQGGSPGKEFYSRLLAEWPGLAIVWDNAENQSRSGVPGAIYDYPARFSIWCVDENLCPDYEALLGSDWNYDAAHPGAMMLLGKVRKVLADENKRDKDKLDLGGSVKVIGLGSEDVEREDLAGRLIVLSLGIEVFSSYENPDAPSEHLAVNAIDVQPNLTHLNADGSFDPSNYVVSGLRFNDGATGLTQSMGSGTAYVGGALVTPVVLSHSFDADADTYRDLDGDGAFTYSAVPIGADPPALATGSIRVAYTRTDAMGVVFDAPMAATSAPFGEIFTVPKP